VVRMISAGSASLKNLVPGTAFMVSTGISTGKAATLLDLGAVQGVFMARALARRGAQGDQASTRGCRGDRCGTNPCPRPTGLRIGYLMSARGEALPISRASFRCRGCVDVLEHVSDS